MVMLRYGRNFSGTGQNLATGFVALKHWDDRAGEENTAQAIRERAMKHFRSNRDAQVNISMPASVNGLGQTDGLDFWIRDINGNGRQYLEEQFQNMQAGAAQYSSFENLDKRSNPEKAELKVNIDQKQAMANGLSQSAINSTLSAAWGGNYINDFIDRGRIKRVIMQGDAEFRSKPEDLAQWHVRNDLNEMVPLVISLRWTGVAVPRWLTVLWAIPHYKWKRIWSKVLALVKPCKMLKIWWQNRMVLMWSGAVYPLRKNNLVIRQSGFIWCRSVLFSCVWLLYMKAGRFRLRLCPRFLLGLVGILFSVFWRTFQMIFTSRLLCSPRLVCPVRMQF